MLSICLNELKKLKRQKTARMLWAVGILIPTFGTLLCIKNHTTLQVFNKKCRMKHFGV